MIKLFQKFAQVEGAKPSSLVATSETPLSFESARKRVNFSSQTKKKEKTTSVVFSFFIFILGSH